MSGEAIKQEDRSALDAISGYQAPLKAHILGLMEKEDMIGR
jgi:hypothetical protein